MPSWVKTDNKRFPRARVSKVAGQPPVIQDVTSLFDNNTLHADCRAFRALMNHVREFDAGHNTIIMVQVENECGLRGDSRDRSDIANKAFTAAVPAELVERLDAEWESLKPSLRDALRHRRDGGRLVKGKPWEETFGSSQQVDELFMAYHYAKYLDAVARVGKEQHPLPMYANAWQSSSEAGAAGGGSTPGVYPSGGPVPGVLDIWQLFAPSLDFLSPDIYMDDYDVVCDAYRHRLQPLFIPEQRRDEYGALRIWSAIGTHDALGTSPFGIDTDHPSTSPFTAHFELLIRVAPFILAARQDGRRMYGFFFDRYEPGSTDPTRPKTVQFGQWSLTIERAHVFGHPGPGYGLVIEQSTGEFLLVGEGFQVEFRSTEPTAAFTSIASFEEKQVVDGKLFTERLLNGDEVSVDSSTGSVARMPGPDPDYGDFNIAISIPSRTKIALARPYFLTD